MNSLDVYMRTSPLLVSYQVEGRKTDWMQEQLELGSRMFKIAIENITTISRNDINSIKYFLFFSDSRHDLQRNLKNLNYDVN